MYPVLPEVHRSVVGIMRCDIFNEFCNRTPANYTGERLTCLFKPRFPQKRCSKRHNCQLSLPETAITDNSELPITRAAITQSYEH